MRPNPQSIPLIQHGDVIVFQGDSITNAFRRPGEVIDAYQFGSGYVLMIAAHLLRSRPADHLKFFNHGVSGNTIVDIASRWNRDTLSLKPSVISLLIGINDVGQEIGGNTAMSPEQFEHDYRALLLSSRKALPAVRLVLCEPFALPCGRVDKHWLPSLSQRQWVVESLAREFAAVFVPLQKDFDRAARRTAPKYWTHDGIHPTAAGHSLIAQAWLQSVRRLSQSRMIGRRPLLWNASRSRSTSKLASSTS